MYATVHPVRDTAHGLVCYVVAGCDGHCAVIDPLVPAELIAELVAANGYVVDWILVTHAQAGLWPVIDTLRSQLPCVRTGGLAGFAPPAPLDRCFADQERIAVGAHRAHVEVTAGDQQHAGYVFADCVFVAADRAASRKAQCSSAEQRRVFASRSVPPCGQRPPVDRLARARHAPRGVNAAQVEL